MTSSVYLAMAEQEGGQRFQRPTMGLNDPKVAALRCFRRYSRDATFDVVDVEGRLRWITQKQMRVLGILHRIAMSPDGTSKMVDIALEAHCTTSTVSRTILKLQGWGLFAVDVRRGRNGGIRIWRNDGQSWMTDYMRAARRKLWELANRAQIKLASMIRGGEQVSETVSEDVNSDSHNMDASFTSRVLYERAMLALTDPEGEHDPNVRTPLTTQEAIENAFLLAEDANRRMDEAIRQAAFAGDWDRWDMLRKNRWG